MRIKLIESGGPEQLGSSFLQERNGDSFPFFPVNYTLLVITAILVGMLVILWEKLVKSVSTYFKWEPYITGFLDAFGKILIFMGGVLFFAANH